MVFKIAWLQKDFSVYFQFGEFCERNVEKKKIKNANSSYDNRICIWGQKMTDKIAGKCLIAKSFLL
jgi:hypothetical protein